MTDPVRPLVVQLHGELALSQANDLREKLLEVVAGTSDRLVVLDLTDVEFVDSTAIGVIIGARKRLLTQGRQLWVAGPNDAVLRILKTVSLDKLIPVFGSVEEADLAATELTSPLDTES
jgi:anti-anti-sigma factor